MFEIIYLICSILLAVLLIVMDIINDHRRYCICVDHEYFENVRVGFHFSHKVDIYPEYAEKITIHYRRLEIQSSCWASQVIRNSSNDQL